MTGTQLLIAAFITMLGGAIGGVLNAAGSGEGLQLPSRRQTEQGTVWLPGSLYTLIAGAFAGFISWILYGGVSLVVVNASTTAAAVSNSTTPAAPSTAPFILALLTSFASAILVGFSGAKWLTSESEKQLVKAGASIAANKAPSTEASNQIAAASSPLEVLEIAENMPPAS